VFSKQDNKEANIKFQARDIPRTYRKIEPELEKGEAKGLTYAGVKM